MHARCGDCHRHRCGRAGRQRTRRTTAASGARRGATCWCRRCRSNRTRHHRRGRHGRGGRVARGRIAQAPNVGARNAGDVIEAARCRIRRERTDWTTACEEVVDRCRAVARVEREGLDPSTAGIGMEVDVAERGREVAALVPDAADRGRPAEQRTGHALAVRCLHAERERQGFARGVVRRPARVRSPMDPVDRRSFANEHFVRQRHLR